MSETPEYMIRVFEDILASSPELLFLFLVMDVREWNLTGKHLVQNRPPATGVQALTGIANTLGAAGKDIATEVSQALAGVQAAKTLAAKDIINTFEQLPGDLQTAARSIVSFFAHL